MTGVDWLCAFLKTRPDISLRKPDTASAVRAMGFNKDTVSNIFRFVDDNRLTPDRIYNVNEGNITVNPNGQSNILALKGCRPHGVLSSAEKDGALLPPVLIFPTKRMQQTESNP